MSTGDSREAADVARAVAEFCEEHRLVNDAEPAMERMVAHIVREAQIRVLEEALEHEWVTREGGLDRRSVSSSTLHARIAALKQEG